MDFDHATLRVYQSEDPHTAFRALADALSSSLPLRCALRLHVPEQEIGAAWPEETQILPDFLDAGIRLRSPAILPMDPRPPTESALPDVEALLLPIQCTEGDRATLLVADRGAFGEELSPWEAIIHALNAIEERHQRTVGLEAERDELRRRAEESEALYTLGLAAHRTLDPDEVVGLVVRFTRALLGAHYTAVSTLEDGGVRLRASVGLREDPLGEDRLANRVIAEKRPLVVGPGAGADARPEEFPGHAERGMRSGLGIPLSLFGETFGALVVGFRHSAPLSSREVRLALTLAGHAAVALSNARLHRRVAEAYEQLQRATALQEQLFNAISHDLRTPVGAIKGYNDLLLDGVAGELPPLAERYLRSTGRVADGLLTLVNDLLDLAKLRAGKLEVEIHPCGLGELLEDALSTVRPQAAAKGLRLVRPAWDGLPALETDARRVRQIVVNLLSNAVKFTEEGEVRLTLRRSASGPEWLEICVSDTGRGIPPESLERIFEEYEQVTGSDGTGLGLPLSRTLARLLGGDLRAESEVGRGSTFVLRLPAAPAPGESGQSIP